MRKEVYESVRHENTHSNNIREVRVVKRFFAIALVAIAIIALTVVPALAEGYNGYSFDGAGNITDGTGAYTRASGYAAGPHGGYNSTTNKCQDCHSTHYAAGSYVLLRANSREAACDYCHVGGGGSTVNIQMDNTYNTAAAVAGGADAIVDTGDSRGMGVGHTLGYSGNAPVDINPAFSDPDGLACFDCHTPHGNSARVLSTFANPGRAFEPTNLVTGVFGMAGRDVSAAFAVAYPAAVSTSAKGNTLYNLGAATDLAAGGQVKLWGLTESEGNIVFNDGTDAKGVMKKPIWPTGRFLLLKNPDVEIVGGVEVSDMTTDTVAGDGISDEENKYAINWDDPLGPADPNYGGVQDRDYNKTMPWNPSPSAAAEFGSDNYGLSAVSEFCTDCHDGAAGASTQAANVWYPDEVANDDTGAYTVVYSHDAQPRH